LAIARNQTWILASHVLVYARGLILLPVLIKTLGPGVYGSLILLLATAEVIYGISSLGLDYRFCREMPSTTGRTAKRALFYGQFWPHALLVLVAITLILAASSTGFSILPEVDAGWLIALLLVANFCYDKLTDYLGYTDRQGWLAVALTAAPYLNIAIVLVSLLLTQVTLSHLVWISAAVQIATALPILVLLLTEIGVTVRLPAISELSGNVRLGFPLVCAYMVDFILGTSDRFVIAHFMGPEAVGYYSPAYALGSLIILVPKALGIVLPPALSREFDAGNLEQVDKVVNAALQAYLTIAIPFILCAIVVGKGRPHAFYQRVDWCDRWQVDTGSRFRHVVFRPQSHPCERALRLSPDRTHVPADAGGGRAQSRAQRGFDRQSEGHWYRGGNDAHFVRRGVCDSEHRHPPVSKAAS